MIRQFFPGHRVLLRLPAAGQDPEAQVRRVRIRLQEGELLMRRRRVRKQRLEQDVVKRHYEETI